MSGSTLFHYTNLEALHSIVETKTIRATNVYYLNDSEEIHYARKLFIESLTETSLPEEYKKQLTEWDERWLKDVHHIFTISFCVDGDKLSQWRGYSIHHKGISIGFDEETLKNLDPEFTLEKCIYDINTQKETIRTLINDTYTKVIAELTPSSDTSLSVGIAGDYGEELHDLFTDKIKSDLLKTFCKIKPPHFSEEQEYRLISKYYPSNQDPKIKFRPGKTTLIPYIEIDLKKISTETPLFTQVIVGPSSNSKLKYQSISHFLRNTSTCSSTTTTKQTLRET